MTTNDKIFRIVLTAAVLLGLSWPAAAQPRAEGSVAQLDLNAAPFTAAATATEAESVGFLGNIDAAEPDAESTETTEVAATPDEVVMMGPYGPEAVTSWASRTAGPRSRVRSVNIGTRRPDKD